ncbi:MAG: hypothetical protein HRU39_05315, partial [Salinicola sp.]|uniref:hydroxyacylglutathione hydrolase C-terminal domain-containing protein n=1 Tax=Salinicola sp. TaxID=1978524 RepID=UPI001DDA1CDD
KSAKGVTGEGIYADGMVEHDGHVGKLLAKLDALPEDTLVFAAHEYTLANLAFAAAAEPDNAIRDSYRAECQRARDLDRPTLPTTLGRERQINPFLRIGDPGLLETLRQQGPVDDDATAFATLRAWKDRF